MWLELRKIGRGDYNVRESRWWRSPSQTVKTCAYALKTQYILRNVSEAAEDLKNHTADPISTADDEKSPDVNLATAEGVNTHTSNQTGIVHDDKSDTAYMYLNVSSNENSYTSYLKTELADGGHGSTVNDTLVAEETITNNANSKVADNTKNHMMNSTAAGVVQNYTTDPIAAGGGTSHTADSAGAGEMQSQTADPIVSDNRNSHTMGKALVTNVL